MTQPSTSLHFQTLSELQAGYRSATVSPGEAAQACLDRIAQLNGRLDAYLQVSADEAAAAARQAAPGWDPQHPLRAIPYALKDNFDVAGLATTCHSRPRAQAIATQNSAAKTMLDDAGAIMLGKNSMHELATGGPSFDLAWPPARNPWDPTRHPGGSSSGSAVAVAAGMAYFSLGTDTSGSVRHPATACGIYGFKPAFDAISTEGVVPLSKSLDHVGVLARGARDLASVMSVLATRADERLAYAKVAHEGGQRPLAGYTVGIIDAFSTHLQPDPAIAQAFDETVAGLRRAGCRIVSLNVDPLDKYATCARTMLYAEAFTYHGAAVDAQPEAFGQRTRNRIGQGRSVSTAQYILMRDLQRELTAQLAAQLATVDVAVSLSSLYFPCKIDDVKEVERTYDRQARTPFNLTGLPALSVPCGRANIGLPVGVHLSAGTGRDAALVDFAMAMENAGLCGFMAPPELQGV